MAQIVIDPYDRGEPVSESAISEIPPNVRRFGYIPNFRACLPGDLILFRNIVPSFSCRCISSAQRAFADEDAQWTHAAVFLYDDLIVEAVLSPAFERAAYAQTSLKEFFVSGDVRTFLKVIATRSPYARRACSVVDTVCSRAFSIGWETHLGKWDPIGVPNFGPVIICSKVFHDACVEVTRALLQGCSIDRPITPAHLSATTSLEDIDVKWIQIS